MTFILNIVSLLAVVLRRLRSHLVMLLTVWLGFTLVVALVVSIPIFTEAASYRILLHSLAKTDASDALSPFAMVYSYGLGKAEPISVAAYRRADELATNRLQHIGLPLRQMVRYAATDKLRITPADGSFSEIGYVSVGYLSDARDHMTLIEGAWPSAVDAGQPLAVAVSEKQADSLGLLVGDSYVLRSPPGQKQKIALPCTISGIWRANDPRDTYWFRPAASFDDMLLLPEESLVAALGGQEQPWLRYAAWYADLDGSAVRSDDVDALSNAIGAATANIRGELPGAFLSASPTAALAEHRRQVQLLTITLALFSVPLIAVLGAFISQMMGMVVSRQQQEIAVMRSRGSSRSQIVGLALAEGLAVCGAALLCGVPLGLLTAQLIAWTRSFLSFAPLPGPQISLLDASWQHGALLLAVALPAMLAPTFAAAGRTIVSFKAERARDVRRPLWQRTYFDLLLLLPALYGYWQLRAQGQISIPGIAAPADDPFTNPLLLLAPTLLIFALSLVALRIIPTLLALLARLFEQLPGISLLMAMRFLSRTSTTYSGLILLMVLTLSLATFTASMARTLDTHALARATYSTGADLRLLDRGTQVLIARPNETVPALTSEVAAQVNASGGEAALPAGSFRYSFVPVQEYRAYRGITAVARVARARASISGGDASITMLGLDRAELPAVIGAGWQPSYASQPLGTLMNMLAETPAAALVSARHAAALGIEVGERVRLDMNDLGETHSVSFVVVGLLDYFPTLYPEDGPFMIGNLDYIFDAQGGSFPYEVWMAADAEADTSAIMAANLSKGMTTLQFAGPQEQLAATLLRPERQGLFGLLSVGFLALVLVTVIGFLVYTLRSFQRRLIEMGIMRAIGLSVRQLATLLIFEQALVISLGTLVGTLIGVSVSQLFMPFLQVRTGDHPNTPPFVVQIAWDQIGFVYAAVAALLVVTVAATLLLLRRMRIFEAVKLGEAV